MIRSPIRSCSERANLRGRAPGHRLFRSIVLSGLGELGRVDYERFQSVHRWVEYYHDTKQSGFFLLSGRRARRLKSARAGGILQGAECPDKIRVGISTDRGLTDEGDPSIVFSRQDDEEVIVHLARIRGEYVVASNFTEGVLRRRSFEALVREMLDSQPVVLPKQHSSRSTVPSASRHTVGRLGGHGLRQEQSN